MDRFSERQFPLRPLKWYKGLDTAASRRKSGFFLAEGERAIQQISAASPGSIAEILAVNQPPHWLGSYPFRLLEESQFKSIAPSVTPQGIMALVRTPDGMYSESAPLQAGNRVLLLEDIQDPGNVGTLIRTAAAFDYSGVILTDKCADPMSPKCVQASAGTLFAPWLRRTANYLEIASALKEQGFRLVAAHLGGSGNPETITGIDKVILALGNETAGLSPGLVSLADASVRIPINREKAESLNVAVSGAIVMYLGAVRRK